MAKNKITRKDIVDSNVLKIGVDYSKSLQPAIEANAKWLETFEPIKAAALEYAAIEKQFKVSEGRKEFIAIKKLEEELRLKTANALKAEQAALVQVQKVEQAGLDTKKKAIQLGNTENNAKKRNIKLTELEKLEIRLLNRGKREAAIISSKLSTEYEKQSIKLIQLKRQYKDVALTQGESSTAAQKLKNEIAELDARLKKVDANVGEFRRNVGNYTKAMQSARAAARQFASALGLIGGAFLVVQVIKDAIKVLRDFEKGNATLSAVLQVSSDDMVALTDDAIRLGQTTVKTANEVTQLQIAYARLGFEQAEILALTEGTIAGSIAMNAELDQTATLTGAVVNTFDDLSATDAPRILDILSLSTAKSALNFQKLETGIPIVAGAANAAGVPFTKLVALMGKLSDSGIDVSTSSTALRNIFIESAAAGDNYEQIIERIKGSQDKLTAANDAFGKRAAVSATVLAQNIEKTNELDEALQNAAGTAQQMADKELDTLDGSIKLLRSAWEGYILELDKSTDSTLTMKDAIRFISTNLKDIIKTIVTAVKIWAAYKVAVLLARVQTSLMNKQLALTRLNAIRGSQGVNIATLSWRKFNAALKANALFLVVAGIVALVAVLQKLNKPLSETVAEMDELNDSFISQSQTAIGLNNDLNTLADRHDVLKSKSKLSKKEQKELDDIIKAIAKHVPEAVTEIDKYGDAMDINTGKVREFTKANNEIYGLEAGIKIKEQTNLLEDLKQAQASFNKVSEDGNGVLIKGFGVIKKQGNAFVKVTTEISKAGNARFVETKLTDAQTLAYKKAQLELEKNIKTVQENIEQNEDVVASVTGVKNARQLEADAAAKAAEDSQKLADAKLEEIKVVGVLKSEIAQLETQLKTLTKNGYDNLNQSQIDLIKETRKLISEKKRELNSILGITKANKNADKAAKDRLKAEKKLRDDAFKLGNFTLKTKIAEQKAIVENETETFKIRRAAAQQQAALEIEQAKLVAKNKFDVSKGFTDKEIEALITKSKVSKDILEKQTDEELLIIEEYQAEKKRITGAKEDTEDGLDLEKLKSDAAIEKAVIEKKLNDELAQENDFFNKREGIYADEENATENREKRILAIKTKYAIEALNAQVAAAEALLLSEDLSAEKRAEIEAKLAAYKLEISNLKTDLLISNNDREVLSEREKAEQILDIAGQLANAIGDLINSIFEARIAKIDGEIDAENEKFDTLLANENLSDEQTQALEQQKAQRLEELEKKKRKEQRKQAILDKALAVVNIGIATAVAAMQAYAQLGPIGGTVGAALVVALGAIQTAAVIAKPIPKYALGTEDHPGGFALVAEERPEVITEPGKKPYVISKPTVKEFPKHTRVTPSLEEYDRLLKASVLTSLSADNNKLNSFQARQQFELNDSELLDEMRETNKLLRRKQPIHLHGGNVDLSTAMADAMWRANNVNWHKD